MAKVTVVIDGVETSFELSQDGNTILDAALDAGVDAPYSCKGGVCTTCMGKVLQGEVKMDKNFALTDKEVSGGMVLCCQAHPISDDVRISWD
jgi:ring-1,2-phenylacetyl-CoA epoxidase subunit PaaE